MDLVSVYRDVLTLQLGAGVELVNEELRGDVVALANASTRRAEPAPHRGGLRGARADAGVQRAAAAGARVDDGRPPGRPRLTDPADLTVSAYACRMSAPVPHPPPAAAAPQHDDDRGRRGARGRAGGERRPDSPAGLPGPSSRDDGGAGGSATAPPPAPSATAPTPSYAAGPGAVLRAEARLARLRRATSAPASRCRSTTRSPTGKAITLAVLRVPATDRGQRVGQLVVNPGGPGGSGVDYAAAGAVAFGSHAHALLRHRRLRPARRRQEHAAGVRRHRSRPTSSSPRIRPRPGHPAEVATLDRLTREFGEGCLTKSGDLARHISTVEAAKDMDILRAALGERQLDYLGASYGTFLGATYADLFPTHVRRMVLDGAIDPAAVQRAARRSVRPAASRRRCTPTSRTASGEGNCVLGDTRRRRRPADPPAPRPASTPSRCRPRAVAS